VKVVVLCLDKVGPRMAGIAIRSVEIARQLSPRADVVLAAARSDGDVELDVPVVSYSRHDGRSVRRLLAGADAVVCQPQWPLVMRELRASGARLIFDLSCPEIVETLTFRRDGNPARRRLITAMTTDRLVEALRIGHHFVATILQNAEELTSPPMRHTLFAVAAVLLFSAAMLSFIGWAIKQPIKRYGVRA
jgi:hypothetical protein